MKVLFLGQITNGQTSKMRMAALTRLGHEVRGVDTTAPWIRASWFSRQLQRRFQFGAVVDEINQSIVNAAVPFRPDLVWAEKQEFVHRETLDFLSRQGARLVHFTPDPYFTLGWKRTNVMDDAFSGFDFLIYCKSYEKSAYESLGKLALYMPLGYCDEVHVPRQSRADRWRCDVGFLGGWEPRRERLTRALLKSGIDLKLWGGSWDFLCDGRWTLRRHLILRQLAGSDVFDIRIDPLLARAYQGDEVYGDDYALALSGAKIGLGLLRKVCPDQHTTRTFEIPACGSMLIADRTSEHQEFFEEGVEAEFFSSELELIDKIGFYLRHEGSRHKVAVAGLARCRAGRYAYIHRIADVLEIVGRY